MWITIQELYDVVRFVVLSKSRIFENMFAKKTKTHRNAQIPSVSPGDVPVWSYLENNGKSIDEIK